jgi:hypothetical protein
MAMRLSTAIKETCKQLGIEYHNIPTDGSRLTELIQLTSDLLARMLRSVDNQLQQLQQQQQPQQRVNPPMVPDDEGSVVNGFEVPQQDASGADYFHRSTYTNLDKRFSQVASSSSVEDFTSAGAGGRWTPLASLANTSSILARRHNTSVGPGTAPVGNQFRRSTSPLWAASTTGGAGPGRNHQHLLAHRQTPPSTRASPNQAPIRLSPNDAAGINHITAVESRRFNASDSSQQHSTAAGMEVSPSNVLQMRLKKAQQAFASMREPL